MTGAGCLTPGSTPQGPPTVRVVFDTPGTATVAAECGNTLTFTAGVLDIGPFTVTAAGLTTGTAEDSSPVEESREDGAVLYTGPTDDGVIAFTLECELHDLFLYPPPPGVPTPSGADVGWRIQDKTGNLLTAGQFSAVEGDFATGTVSVNWAIGAADGIVQEVDFVAYYKGAGVIGGGGDGIRRLIHCTIVKPDLILHRPKVQDGAGAAVDGWTDADSDGVRDASEEEETDPGLFMAVNDDFDSGGPDPDCEDAEVAGTAEQIAADLDDMAQVEISLPGGELLPDNACLEITAAPQAPVRLFRVVSTDSNGDGTIDVREYEPVVGKDAAATWTIPLAEFRGSAGTSGFWLEGAEPGQTTLTVGFVPPSPPPPPPTDPPDYSICQAPGGGDAATAPVGRDVARAGAIALQLDSRWLASHDPPFEAECWGSSRLRQSAVMANTITATVCTGSASVPGLECRLYEHDMWWDDPVAVGKASGPGCFVFTTDDDGDGAEETDADGAIYVNGAKLAQGPESHPYTDYRIGVFVAGRRVREEDVTVGPLLHGLGFTPDLLASPPAKMDPYNDRVDAKIDNIPFFPWDDDEEGYGLLIRYLLATDVSGLQFTFSGIGSDSYADTNANGQWDQGEPLPYDDGDGSYDPAGETLMSHALLLAVEYTEARPWWNPARIKWEGYYGLPEEAHRVVKFPEEAEVGATGPGYGPGGVVREGRYMLRIWVQHKEWPSQTQCYEVDFAVKYGY